MSEGIIVRYCSPTLAGLKTGSLFSCPYRRRSDVISFLRKWNINLKSKGIRLIPLKINDGKALIYVYRPSRLKSDLSSNEVCSLLCERGYCVDNCEKCIAGLMKRLCESADFPHEIGLFLGYPLEDVKGFIENKAENSKLVGCWKVYGDEKEAQKTFEKYRKCKQIYQKQWAVGKPLTKLTVAR